MYVSSQSPYYDDYTESKKFYRILFRPGRAVQARELTQLQTLLQKQIERFGSNIFKEGSIVIPGTQVLDTNYKYVKLASSYNSVAANSVLADLVGQTIVGRTTGVRALVVNYAASTSAGDPPTLYVKYTSSGTTGEYTAFSDSEIIDNEAEDTSVQAASSAATGSGTSFSVGSGVVFIKGNFVYFDEQTLVVEKYDKASDFIVGFLVTEDVVTSDDDTTLLDPAVGSYNYFAPGADRYKIDLTLETRAFTPASTDDPNYIELIRVENKVIISQTLSSEYNILNDTLARRTNDESGSYVVRPYRLEVMEHLRTSNTSVRDGIYTTIQGGDENKAVGIVSPGKSYVNGYELENITTQFVPFTKARDSISVNNSTVATEFGNYVLLSNLKSIPDIASLVEVDLYDRYTSSTGSASGSKVGTARIRGLQFYSGSIGTITAVYQAWLFDVQMNTGYSFERNVKQIYYNNAGFDDFTADIVPQQVSLTGSFTTSATSNVIAGSGTRFTSELSVGDYFTLANNSTYRVGVINSDVSVYLNANANVTYNGVSGTRNQAIINSTDKAAYIFEFPYSTIKTVDPTDVETSYSTRRVYDRTLSGGNVSITAGTDETFAAYSSDNYILVDKSTGDYVDLAGKVARSGSPTGKTITFTLGGSYTNEDVRIISTIQKTSSAANKKTKTLVEDSTTDFTSNVAAQATVLSIGQADVYQIKSIKMSGNAFGTAYSTTDEIDITPRYTLDNGQRITHYDIGTVTLKSNQPKPTGPVRITFDYFTHSSGDYFSVDSYGDIAYKDIPTYTYGGKTYKLRDCLDFRPRIDTNGSTFTSPSEFLDFETDLLTDYEYYVGRTDKIVIDSTGRIKVVNGLSSLSPKEPATPSNSMALYVIKQKPYVFNVKNDIDVISIDNKRYTMRDIGRIENRVKNLEYYTQLSLLEKDTSLFQIKDSLGFDRFKNGFVVDNFSGHKIGDARNPDYGVSMDFNKGIMRPLFDMKYLSLNEISTTTGQRTSNNYTKTGNVVTLPYTSNILLQSNAASRVENINPFSVVNWVGTIELDPPADNWIDTNRLPDVYINREGNFDTLVSDSQAKGTWGTVWGSWRDTWYGNQRSDTSVYSNGSQIITTTTTSTDVQQERTGTDYSVVETIDVSTNNDVVINRVIIPKMRSININFHAKGMKPNTKLQAFFNNFRITDYCVGSGSTTADANVALQGFVTNRSILVTNENGELSGTFYYDAGHFDFQTGDKTFRLSDSPTNGRDAETMAEATFKSSGELVTVRNEIISTRNGELSSKAVYESRTTTTSESSSSIQTVDNGGGYDGNSGGDPGPDTTPTTVANPTVWDAIYSAAFGRAPDAGGVQYWSETKNYDQSIYRNLNAAVLGSGDLARLQDAVSPDGTIEGYAAHQLVFVDADLTEAYDKIKTIVAAGYNNNEQSNPNGLLAQHLADGLSRSEAIRQTAAQITVALTLGQTAGGASSLTDQSWGTYVDSLWDQSTSVAFGNTYTGTTYSAGSTTSDGYDCNNDPLAQTFRIGGSPGMVTKVDVYFYDKDTSIPVIMELRKVVNGNPTQDVIPFSRVLKNPADITTSDDGSSATSFVFDAPIYLEQGEYAIVLLTNSINYKVWISQVGEEDIQSGKVISEQPFVGVLFKSQNASTWTADQTQDLKFRLYTAEYDTSLTANVDFEVNVDEFQFTSLDNDPIEIYPNSAVAKIYHPNHGFVNGGTVVLNGFPDYGVNEANVEVDWYGLNTITLEGVEFAVSNVKQDSYTIILPDAVANVTTTTRTGNIILATQDLKYDTLFPALAAVEYAGTKVQYSIKATDSGYSLNSSFVNISSVDDNELDTTKVIPNDENITNNLSGSRPFTLRATLTTSLRGVSPLVDLKQVGALFVNNLVNNPTYASENLVEDIVTIASSNNIFITNSSTNEGYVSLTSVADRANAVAIAKGTTITLSGSANNNGTFRVLDVLDSGANIKVYGTTITEATGSTITITNGKAFVAEEAASGGTATSKYITRQIDFVNPSTSFNFRMDIRKPVDTNVKVYYKTRLIGETSPLADKEFVELTGITIPQSLGGEFYEVEKQIDDLSQFDAIILKVVLLSDDSASVPMCKNLRLIALA